MSSIPPQIAFGQTARILLSLFLLTAIAGFGLALMVIPDPRGFGTHQQFGLPPCTFQVVFGIPCPSCGGTTSFAYFVRGHWVQSLQSNAAAFAGALISVLLVPWSAACLWRNRWLGVHRPDKALLPLLTVITLIAVGQWIIRAVGH